MLSIIVWAVVTVALLIIEACTVQLVTIWFAAGALCGLIATLFHSPVWLQITIAVVVSFILLLLTRPIVKKLRSKKIQPTNADRVIGKVAIVDEDIDNDNGKGSVKVGGTVWSARSKDNEALLKGQKVTVDRIDGVKLIVTQQK